MPMFACVLLLGAAAPPVEVALLDGTSLAGPLLGLNGEGLIVRADGKPRTVPLDQVFVIDFAAADAGEPPAPAALAMTTGGSVLRGDRVGIADRDLTLQTGDESLTLPIADIVSVLLRPADPADRAAWRAEAVQPRSGDILVAFREGKTFTLEGIFGDLDESGLTFLLDGDPIPVKPERLHALHFGRRQPTTPAALVRDTAGNRWAADSLTFTGDGLTIAAPDGRTRTVRTDDLVQIDFAQGRIRYLSDVEPVLLQQTPYVDVVWEPRRDRNLYGDPLAVAGVRYRRGLSLHSRTVLEYDLDGDYRLLRLEAGIDDSASGKGDADLILSADASELARHRLRAGEPATAVEIDLTGRRRLTVELDFGANLDVGDHAVLGNARLIK